MNRYDRQMRLPEVGKAGQSALQQAHILVIGVGGLGAHLLPLLGGAGIGHIRLYDGDQVEQHNLHRQTVFCEADVGQSKAVAAVAHLQALNAEVNWQAVNQHVTPDNLADALDGVDLVVDAADRLAVTYLLSDACRDRRLPLVSASAIKQQGYVGGFCGQGPDYRALFPQLTTAGGNCNSDGVFGPVVATLGCIQAQMVLNLLLDLAPSAIGQLWRFDFASWQLGSFRFDAATTTEAGIPLIGKQALNSADCVVELRSSDEAPVAIVPQALRLTPDDLERWTPPNNQRLVFACASGVRATRAALSYRQQGVTDIAVMAASFYP